MAQIIWTESALKDIDDIAAFIALDSAFYATQFVIKIISQTKKLENYPLIGKVVPELKGLNYREMLYKKYRIIYRIEGENIFVISVHHSSRLLSNNEFFKDLFE